MNAHFPKRLSSNELFFSGRLQTDNHTPPTPHLKNMSSCYTTVTASVVQIAATGALGKMLENLRSREVDVFASSYFTTKPFAHGFERSAHEEQIYASKKNASIKSKFEISRAFDLVHQLYIVIDLPGIANVVGSDKIAAAEGIWLRPH